MNNKQKSTFYLQRTGYVKSTHPYQCGTHLMVQYWNARTSRVMVFKLTAVYNYIKKSINQKLKQQICTGKLAQHKSTHIFIDHNRHGIARCQIRLILIAFAHISLISRG